MVTHLAINVAILWHTPFHDPQCVKDEKGLKGKHGRMKGVEV